MTDAQPLVSIVTPSFNQGPSIEETIRSVLEQDYPHVEYLVMDGGSTDHTLEVLRKYERRLTWKSGPDGGQAQALCVGFQRARGEILAWINADDAYTPGAITRAVRALAAEPAAGLVFGNAEFMDAHGRPLGPAAHVAPLRDPRPLLRFGDCIAQAATFYRRSAYEMVGGLDAGLHWALDYDLWIRLARAFPTRFIDAALARVRCMPSTKTATGGWDRMAEIEGVIRKHGGSRLPAWFALEAAAMHAREALGATRQRDLAAALAAGVAAVKRLASPATMVALASPRTWRLVRQRRKNEGAR